MLAHPIADGSAATSWTISEPAGTTCNESRYSPPAITC
jgi:hypothetical protein